MKYIGKHFEKFADFGQLFTLFHVKFFVQCTDIEKLVISDFSLMQNRVCSKLLETIMMLKRFNILQW